MPLWQRRSAGCFNYPCVGWERARTPEAQIRRTLEVHGVDDAKTREITAVQLRPALDRWRCDATVSNRTATGRANPYHSEFRGDIRVPGGYTEWIDKQRTPWRESHAVEFVFEIQMDAEARSTNRSEYNTTMGAGRENKRRVRAGMVVEPRSGIQVASSVHATRRRMPARPGFEWVSCWNRRRAGAQRRCGCGTSWPEQSTCQEYTWRQSAFLHILRLCRNCKVTNFSSRRK